MIHRMKRISRRMIQTTIAAAAGAAMLLCFAASPAGGQANSTPATTKPARGNRLIAEGVDDAGRITIAVNKTIVITTTQPYRQVSVGQPEIADVNLIGPNNILL